MKRTSLRIAYICSLVVLVVLLVFTVFKPLTFGTEFTEITNESILRDGDRWVIQFNIYNKEGSDISYIIDWSTGGQVYSTRTVLVRNGSGFTNIHHVYPGDVKEGKVHLSVLKEGGTVPFEETTFYLK